MTAAVRQENPHLGWLALPCPLSLAAQALFSREKAFPGCGGLLGSSSARHFSASLASDHIALLCCTAHAWKGRREVRREAGQGGEEPSL